MVQAAYLVPSLVVHVVLNAKLYNVPIMFLYVYLLYFFLYLLYLLIVLGVCTLIVPDLHLTSVAMYQHRTCGMHHDCT